MKLMSRMTVEAIYAIKQGSEKTNYEKLANFMSKYTDTPIEHYNKENLTRIMSSIFGELLDNIQYPGGIFQEYFRYKHYPWNYDEFNAMCATLSVVAVKKRNEETGKYTYINGFWDVEGDLELDDYI